MKSLEDIYANGIIEAGNKFRCSVCDKEYKREKSAISHFEKRDCHSVEDVFGGTNYESVALEFYKNILISEGKKSARPTLKSFRKSSIYKNCVTYIVHCMMSDVDYGLMYSFLNEIVGFKYPNKVLLEGQDNKWLLEFRCFLHNHPEVSGSSEFYDVYKDELLTDDDFLVEAITKAKISVNFVHKRPKLLDVISNLPAGYQMRVMDVMEAADASKWRV